MIPVEKLHVNFLPIYIKSRNIKDDKKSRVLFPAENWKLKKQRNRILVQMYWTVMPQSLRVEPMSCICMILVEDKMVVVCQHIYR